VAKIAFRVCGTHPVGENDPDVDRWCKAVADVEAHYKSKAYGVVRRTEFMVYLVFYISHGKQNLNDLAKPVLNTMFESGGTNDNAAVTGGVLFTGVNQEKINHIALRKREVESFREQGVDVTVVWE